MEIVERAALVEQFGIGGVQILGDTIALVEDAAPERDYPPARVLNGEHHASAEPVVTLALFIGGAHARALKHVLAEPGERLGQRLPVIRCPAESEFGHDLW